MNERVFVYWNLHRDLYSVKNVRSGLVQAHATAVVVRDAELVVSEAGRQRVLREKAKNVHAGVRGHVVELDSPQSVRGWTRLTYNPYKYDSFVRASDEAPVVGADEVRMVIRDGRARVYAKGLRLRSEMKEVA
jgi:hypothetical protein